MYCQQNFFVQHSSWTAGGYTFHQSSTVALSNLMVVRGGTMGSPNAISQQQNINSEIKKPVERKAKKGISPLKKVAFPALLLLTRNFLDVSLRTLSVMESVLFFSLK